MGQRSHQLLNYEKECQVGSLEVRWGTTAGRVKCPLGFSVFCVLRFLLYLADANTATIGSSNTKYFLASLSFFLNYLPQNSGFCSAKQMVVANFRFR